MQLPRQGGSPTLDKKLFRSLLLLITYTVVLILALVRFDELRGFAGTVLNVFRPLFIGFAIAFVLNRPCQFFLRLYRKALPDRAARPLAVVSSYVALIAVITGIFSFIIPQVASSIELFVSNLGGYIAHLQTWVNALLGKLDMEYLQSLDFSGLYDILRQVGNAALDAVSNAVPQLFTLTSGLISVVVTGMLALVFSIYMLSGQETLLGQLRSLTKAYLPEKIRTPLHQVAALTADTFTHFVSGQVLEACILGSLCFLGMLLLRLPYPPLVGVIVGVSALIPVAGAYMGAVVSALLLVMVSPVQAFIFLVFLVILQQIEGNVIYPRVVGTSIGLPGIWVLTAVTVGGGLLGFLGMLIGVPIASVLYTLLKGDVRRRLSL